ncbi:MAG: Gfo/Idh/MocA family oxidoreductase [Pirellulaceae bacterium]|nr:Gfo/Idh/MocA family oxidoreductase [Planctomycetales bacterium]
MHPPATPHAPANDARRRFLKSSGAAVAGLTLLRPGIAPVHAAEDNTIRLALIGCGGRGGGAVANALNTSSQGPIELYAMADIDKAKLDRSHTALKEELGDKINVADDRKLIGFDAYKAAVDLLRPGDVAMCTTRAYIRAVHVEYAVSKGINVFMEKPFACDPTGLRRMLKAGEAADAKGVKIAAGLQCRHSPARAALIEKIQSGEMGELQYVRANRMHSRGWMGDQGERANRVLDQLQFGKSNLFWVGSGHMVDNLIHQIDECCWLMNDWPVSCHGMGGREVGSDDRSQNLDIYHMEYTFPDGRKAFCGFRRALQGFQEFATFVHCTKKSGQFSGNIHAATVHMFKDHRIAKDNIEWSPSPDKKSPWDLEWDDFVYSIRNDRPHNEAKRAVYADYASLMGRAAAHMNQIVTWDDVTQSEFRFIDDLDNFGYDSPPPVLADKEGYFPAPEAGKWVEL